MFRKILIANRGEIALRVIRACKELGVQSAAVYPSVDRAGVWLRHADESHEMKGFRGREAYLNIEAILEIANKAGADAVHPGYGFLSERAEFAAACEKAGLVFIGPSASSIEKAGNKLAARKLAEQAGLPLFPGSPILKNEEEAVAQAKTLGYPVLLKASAGGGGRGMRIVRQAKEMPGAFVAASREAQASFGDGSVYLEKLLSKPRHVEIQILADAHGNAVYLGERECSIQRRYQKLIEESPSTAVDEKLRRRMGEDAVKFVKLAGYVNAGTVEFLLDEQGSYYFLEMNSRIQVEHPVTEMVTGIDLVQWQIRMAAGEYIPWSQHDIKSNGWAFEARINCENPMRDFLPSPGRVERLELPGGPGVRVDTALYQGYEIPGEFDSLIAKLVCWGKTREEAAGRMARALREFRIAGVMTTIPFHLLVFTHPEFLKGNLSTHFIEENLDSMVTSLSLEETRLCALIAALESRVRPVQFLPLSEANAWGAAGRVDHTTVIP